MANPFENNPTFRKVTYRAQWLINGALAVLAAFFAATSDGITDFPKWYLVLVAVLPVLWTYLGVQADTNTSAPATPPKNQGGYIARGGGLLHNIGVLLIVVAVLFFVLALFHLFAVGVGIGGLVLLGIVGLALVLIF